MRTLPTHITTTPRRWYANSFFNHDAHRDQKCMDCHAAIYTGPQDLSELKTMRDQDPPGWDQRELAETHRSNLPGIESCVRCHHPDTAAERGAGANCVLCHVYHDRTRERPAGVAWVAPTTNQVAQAPDK